MRISLAKALLVGARTLKLQTREVLPCGATSYYATRISSFQRYSKKLSWTGVRNRFYKNREHIIKLASNYVTPLHVNFVNDILVPTKHILELSPTVQYFKHC